MKDKCDICKTKGADTFIPSLKKPNQFCKECFKKSKLGKKVNKLDQNNSRSATFIRTKILKIK